MKMFFLVNNDLVSRSQYINHLEHKALFLPKIYCFILVKLKIELGVSFNIQISTIIVTHFHYTLEVLAHVYQQFVNQKFKHFILLNPNVFDFIVRFWFQLDNILLTILGYTPLSVLIVPLHFLNFQYFYPINSMLKYFLIFLSCSILNTSLLLVFLYNLGQAHLQQLSDLLYYQSISLFFLLIPIASQSFIILKCKWGFQQSHQFFFQYFSFVKIHILFYVQNIALFQLQQGLYIKKFVFQTVLSNFLHQNQDKILFPMRRIRLFM